MQNQQASRRIARFQRDALGIDVGGTFTDFVLVKGGRLYIYKTPTTPADLAAAVLQGLEALETPTDAAIIHGSTIATNALLERKGARTALITTKGFEDVLEIGRQNRPSLYDLMQDKLEPLVPSNWRFGVSERIDHTGKVLEPLSTEEVKAIAKKIAQESIQAVAVSFLFAFLNPAHEQRVKEVLQSTENSPLVSLSSEILPEYREYERTSTVVTNAYLMPILARYIASLSQQIKRELYIMQSSGGGISASVAASQPVRTILSGPAAGVVGAFYTGRLASYDHLITLDMGGTSTDVSLCPGRIQESSSSIISGFPIQVPMIDIHTVGAGGGSIARLDSGGALLVGPDSAGAEPGPACYGVGEQPTVTDANLLLGRLEPHHFLGSRMALYPERAHRALERLARQMKTSAIQAAQGVLRVVTSNMERAIRAVSLERGYDPREFTLLAFGGAGPMHACELASELHIPRVLVPYYPGVLSALGAAIADITRDYSRTLMLRGGDLTQERLEAAYRPLAETALREMQAQNVPQGAIRIRRLLDMRYVGQSYELAVDYPEQGDDIIGKAVSLFHQAHNQRFGYSDPRQAVEVVNLRVKAVGIVEKPKPQKHLWAGESPYAAVVGTQDILFGDRFLSSPLYERRRLKAGNVVKGPALLFQLDATTVIPSGWTATVDPYLNLVIEPY